MSEHRSQVDGMYCTEFPCPYPDCDGLFSTEDTDAGGYDELALTSLCPHCERPIEVVTHIDYVATAKPEAEADTYWLEGAET